MSPPGGKNAFGGQRLNLRKRRRPKTSAAQERERQKLIREFIKKHGVTRCPPGFSRVDI